MALHLTIPYWYFKEPLSPLLNHTVYENKSAPATKMNMTFMNEKFSCSCNTVCSRSTWKHSAICNAKLSTFVCTYSTNIPKKYVYSYKPLYLDSKGRCRIHTACSVYHDEFLGSVESCSDSRLHRACSCCHLKELFATWSVYAVIYMWDS